MSQENRFAQPRPDALSLEDNHFDTAAQPETVDDSRDAADSNLPPALPVASRHLLDAQQVTSRTTNSDRPPSPAEATSDQRVQKSKDEPLPSLNGYQVHELIGRGGMGVVYWALDVRLNRSVALKFLPALRNTSAARTRFESEARLLAQVDHPGVARIFEIGNSHGAPYIAMEYVEGQSLDRFAAGKPLEPRLAAEFTRQLAEALSACHLLGIVHRDVKPGNAIISSQRKLKLTDFGLAKLMGEEAKNLTRTGEVMGTPGYMAPEQASGFIREFGPETDVYGAGAVFYELLTGRPPFSAPEPIQTVMLALTTAPVPPRAILPRIPADLETIALKCLEKKKCHRYRSTKELADDLGRYLRGEPILAKPAPIFRKVAAWIRRHPGWSSAMALIAVGIFGSLIAVSAHNAALRRELDRTQRLVAEGRSLSAWLLTDFTKVLESEEGLTFVRSNLADRTQIFLDAMRRQVMDDDGVKLSLAESLNRLANLQGSPGTGSLGMPEVARKNLTAAQSILATLREPNTPDARSLNMANRLDLLAISVDQCEPETGKLLQEARAELFEECSAIADQQRQLLNLQLLSLELLHATQQADFPGGERIIQELAQLEARLPNVEMDLTKFSRTFSNLIRSRYSWLDLQDRAGELIPTIQNGLKRFQELSAEKPFPLPVRLQEAGLRNLLAQALLREAQFDLAESELLQVIDFYQTLLNRDAKNLGARFNLAQAWQSLGEVSMQLDDLDKAGERFKKSVQLFTEYAAQSGLDLTHRSDTLDVYQTLANWHMKRGEIDDARREVQKAIDGYTKFAHLDWKCRVSRADALLQLGGIEMVAYADQSSFEGEDVPPALQQAFDRSVQALQVAIKAFEELETSQKQPELVVGQLARARKMLAFIQDDFKQLRGIKN